MDPASIVLVITIILLRLLSSLNNVKHLRLIRGIGLPQDLQIYRGLAWILKRFTDTYENAIREKYPLVDVNAVKRWYNVKGHHDTDRYDV